MSVYSFARMTFVLVALFVSACGDGPYFVDIGPPPLAGSGGAGGGGGGKAGTSGTGGGSDAGTDDDAGSR